jgi:hypothetical protein
LAEQATNSAALDADMIGEEGNNPSLFQVFQWFQFGWIFVV